MNKEQIEEKLNALEKCIKSSQEALNSLRVLIEESTVTQKIDLESTDFNVPGLLEGLANRGKKNDVDS